MHSRGTRNGGCLCWSSAWTRSITRALLQRVTKKARKVIGDYHISVAATVSVAGNGSSTNSGSEIETLKQHAKDPTGQKHGKGMWRKLREQRVSSVSLHWQNCTSKDCEWTLQVQAWLFKTFTESEQSSVLESFNYKTPTCLGSSPPSWSNGTDRGRLLPIRDRLPTLTVSAGRYWDITVILRFCWNSISVSQKFVVDIL